MMIAAINPWMFGAVFLVVLAILILVSRGERSAAVRPFEQQAKQLGPVRCKGCSFEGVLAVKVKTQLGRSMDEPVPKVESCTLVCSRCGKSDWEPLAKA